MKKEGTLLGVPPEREVSRVVELVGERGGLVFVLALACGHWSARRRLPAKKVVPCVGCLIEAALRERRTTWEDITDQQLVQLGRDAHGPSVDACLARQLVPVALGIFKEDAAEVQYARKRCARLWNAKYARSR